MSRRPSLRSTLVLFFAALVIGVLSLFWLGTRSAPSVPASTDDFDDPQRIARGAYLAQIGNCVTCHTATGGAPYAGGGSIPTPFGTFYGTNLTPDSATGIGHWSADDFWLALHEGRGPDGQLYYPAFPYPSYTKVSREDADAIYAYLRRVPPVERPNQPHDLRFPYDQRALLAFWRARYFRQGDAPAASDTTPLWERGAYLVHGLGHCAECHTPRTRWGGLRLDQNLQGTAMPMGDWYAPALTPSAHNGLAAWSTDDIVQLLHTGISRHGTAIGPMAEVVSASTQYLTPEDARAIASYLQRLPARSSAPTGRLAGSGTTHGGELYQLHCASCHGAQGEGEAPGWPALAGNLTVQLTDPGNAIRSVLDGGFSAATRTYPQPYGMPPFRQFLSDADIAAILTFVRQEWGNQASGVMAHEVRRTRQSAGR